MPWKVCKPMDERLKCSAAGRGEDSGGVPRLRHGTLTIRGRKKEMAIVGGFSVSPREIEDVLLMHPAVVEAAAIGCARQLSRRSCPCLCRSPEHKRRERTNVDRSLR
jgi:acyl-CoA synthetase (AMP-forming)/AMP-acid ligase II